MAKDKLISCAFLKGRLTDIEEELKEEFDTYTVGEIFEAVYEALDRATEIKGEPAVDEFGWFYNK